MSVRSETHENRVSDDEPIQGGTLQIDCWPVAVGIAERAEAVEFVRISEGICRDRPDGDCGAIYRY